MRNDNTGEVRLPDEPHQRIARMTHPITIGAATPILVETIGKAEAPTCHCGQESPFCYPCADCLVLPLFDGAEFGLRVRMAMARANLSYRQLAKQIGVDQASIHRVAKHGKPPCIETYLRLIRWLGGAE